MSPEIHEMIHDLETSKLRQIVFKIQEVLNEAHVGLDWFEGIVQEAMEAQKSEAANNPADPFNITDEQYREACETRYGRDGDLEIDDGAEVSRGDDSGAYVQAWKWISDSQVRHTLSLPEPVCRKCGAPLIHDPDGSVGVVVHMTELGEVDRESDEDHVGIPKIAGEEKTRA